MKKIYIIHGWTYTKDAWKNCVEKITAAGFEPVLLSVPGLSEASEEVWTLEKYVNWLKMTLPKEESILVGHSNGGRIAIAYASENPQNLSKLILIDSAGIVHTEFSIQLKRSVFGFVAKAGKIFAGVPFIRKIFYKIIGANDYERAPKNMRETMKNLISIDLSVALQKIHTPTLIIWGDQDKATPVSDAYVMKEGITGSELVILPGAGHSPHKTHPEIVAQKITAFVGQN